MAAEPQNPHSEAEHFVHLIETLTPWLDQLVVIGGWAHRLHRLHSLAQSLDYEPLGTFDTDVALPAQLPATGEEIGQRLLANGFREERLGHTQPPAAHYHVTSGNTAFYAEFLTPLIGGSVKHGKHDLTARIGGVFVQKLRHLELLLVDPWDIVIASTNGFPTAQPKRIRVPNAAAFLVQKILILDRRPPEDRAKDVLYIHDTFETFAPNLGALREKWYAKIGPTLHQRARRKVENAVADHFQNVDDTLRDAARIATSRALSPESIRELCAYAWANVFT